MDGSALLNNSVARQPKYRQILVPMLLARRLDAICELAGKQRRLLSFLTALSYDPDSLVSWRAVEAIGVAAAQIADDDPEYVRNHLRRQMWLLSDESGGIGWRAPEIMGEIVFRCPQLFGEFVPIIISILDLEAEDVVRFRAGALYALGRLAQALPLEGLASAVERILPCLQAADIQTRGMAQWCLEQGSFRSLPDSIQLEVFEIKPVNSMPGMVLLYEQGELVQRPVF